MRNVETNITKKIENATNMQIRLSLVRLVLSGAVKGPFGDAAYLGEIAALRLSAQHRGAPVI